MFSMKNILLIALVTMFFLWLSDQFAKPNFVEVVSDVIEKKYGKGTSHTFLDLIEKSSNLAAGLMATGFGASLYSFIVKNIIYNYLTL